MGRQGRNGGRKMKIPKDKIAHFVAGFAISAGIAIVGCQFVAPVMPCFGGALVATIAGAVKEAVDQTDPKSVVDPYDFWATALGGIAGAVVVYWGVG
jgi:hypothetical protein